MMMISPPLRSLSLLLLLLLLLATVSTGQISAAVVGEEEATKPTKFNVTAIGARNNASTLECWQLAEPLLDSTVPGQAGGASLNLGAVSRINYIIVPADLAGSLRNAPAIQ
jgi:hypothetical protein